MFWKKSLKSKIVLFNFAVGLISGVLVLSLVYMIGTHTLKQSIGSSFREVAESTGGALQNMIYHHLEEARLLASSASVVSIVDESNSFYTGENPEAVQERVLEIERRWLHAQGADAYLMEVLSNRASLYLREFFNPDAGDSAYHSVLVTNIQGAVVSSVERPNHYYYGDQAWWQEAYYHGAGKLFVGTIEMDPDLGKKVFVISAPIMKKGKAIGVLALVHNVDIFFQALTSAQIGETDHTMLMGSNGTLLFCPIHPLEEHQLSPALIQAITPETAGWTASRVDVHYPGVETINGHAPVEITFDLGIENFGGEKWFIFTSQDPRETYAPIWTLITWMAVAGLVGVIVFALLGIIISSRIVRPIRELQKGAETIGGGNLNYRITIHTGDEIEDLASKFNKMASKLKLFYIGLEEDVRKKGWKIEHQSRELLILYSIAAILNKPLHLKELLSETLHKMLEVMEADAGIIWMPEDLAGKLTVTASRLQPLSSEAMEVLVEVIHHLSQEIMLTGETWTSENIAVDGRLEKFAPIATASFTSLVGIPLRARNKCLGVLYILYRDVHALTTREEQLMASVGDQIGVAIEHALTIQPSQEDSSTKA